MLSARLEVRGCHVVLVNSFFSADLEKEEEEGEAGALLRCANLM